jgi:alpha-glucosidase
MKNRHLLAAFILLLCLPLNAQKRISLQSPDGKLETVVSIGEKIEYTVSHNGDLMLSNSALSMTLAGGNAYGVHPKLSGSSRETVNRTFATAVYKRSVVANHYNELTLRFKGDYRVIFRAYNDGIAYRFVSNAKKPFIVENEQAEFNFPSDPKAYISYANRPEGSFESQYMNSFEQPYHSIPLSEWNKKRLGITPLVVEGANGKKVCIAEADLLNYPGMFLYPTDAGLKGVFAPYPKETKQGGHNLLQELVQSREPYIAKFDGATQFPWRIVIVAEKASDLADSDMVYKLATPPQGDYSWIKPGKVAWEWWNDWNLYNVDFKTGVNNETYQYYIDFASKYGIEYVILDEGWAVNKKADLFQVVPEINLEELVAYAGKKNVGLILWAGYYAFNRDMEKICRHYSEMGIKGFKVDFMDRDDQPMVDFHHRVAQVSAKYRLMIDFHGTYKPTGLQRTYPNVVNFEAVNGLEQLKWSSRELDQVTYDVTIPFIRQVAGPMDYTQGAMRNAGRSNYHPVYSEPMSQGTRCRQLAEYIIFESPLNMLCDSPSNYMNEEECTKFIASVPTVWDNTIALNGEIGQYISMARRKGNDWYIGSLTNWNARTVELDLTFLGEGNFKGEVFRDGINAGRVARDYKKETIDIPADRKLRLSMASGGGYVIKITGK